jgi:ABC-type sugar transport system ATPase subunit
MSNVPALEVRGLSNTFTGQRALIDVDLEVQPGEIRALVGQNGCGKSTLIKVLARGTRTPGGAPRW